MGAAKPPSTHSSSADSAMPGICKELIGQSVACLRGCSGTEKSIADRLVSDLNLVYVAVKSISDLYNSLDDDSQENGEICMCRKVQRTVCTFVIQRALFFILCVCELWFKGVNVLCAILA